nr:hypothetical protein [Micromonospora sp. DSM 115978]
MSEHPFGAKTHTKTQQRTVVAYDPGQVFGTGLAKDLSLPLRTAWSVLGTPLGWPLRRLDRTLNSRTGAADAMADLALGLVTPPAAGIAGAAGAAGTAGTAGTCAALRG